MKLYIAVGDDDGVFYACGVIDAENLKASSGSRRLLEEWKVTKDTGIFCIEIPDGSLALAFPEVPVVKGEVKP